jgi:(1->4)-alpha-D-glucan 1-alpha-D-glucosylmutase
VSEPSTLDHLCEALGILPRYRDHTGADRHVPEATLRALAERLGGRQAQGILPPVVVHRTGHGDIVVPIRSQHGSLRWTLAGKAGSVPTGAVDPAAGRIVISGTLAPGRYTLRLHDGDTIAASCPLIVAPARAFLPALLRDGGRLWGLATQLFALRSPRNWGIGDFTDLGDLAERAAASGAATIGLTPLHALFPDQADRCSPYSPNSRCFLNVLYIDPEAMPEFETCDAVQSLRTQSSFAAELERLRSEPLVDYPGVAACKTRIFELLYAHFRSRHLALEDEYAAQFRSFQEGGGKRLRQFAVFEALRAQLPGSWRAWPEPYRNPENAEVGAFAARSADRVTFFEYLQWHAQRQLLRCQERARAAGMPIGIYLDIAVGVDRDSAEAWWSQDYLVDGWSIGAPPDNWNLKGQSWGTPPPNPARMRETGYAALRECLAANMRAAGAVRIDHILGFMRLFWVPEAADAAAGAYVRYPLEDLLAIVSLESQAHRCLVIGEDLGTVPDGLREALLDAGILTYRLLYFEQEGDGAFRKPEDWPRQALAAPSTHDLPTLPAFWQGADLDLRSRLDLYPTDAIADAERRRRLADREHLLAALAAEDLPVDPSGSAPIESIYRFLARTPSHLLMVQPEDLAGVVDPLNVPGTTREYPNWRRKLPIDVAGLFADARVACVAEAINAEGRHAPHRAQDSSGPPDVPTATYRLQFSKDFTFADATRLVPHLMALGISHVYASSYLKSGSGSAHGYDITDHNELNPEIGDRQAFEEFCGALRNAGMGQILDFIPNHMGIGHAGNRFWLDVLEWGRASPYAAFFDINWRPRQANLRDKVLLPMLGDQYGNVLERGELKLHFEPESGTFAVWYFDHRFPIHPRCYHHILADIDPDLRRLATSMTEVSEAALRSIGEKLQQELAHFVRRGADRLKQIAGAADRFNGELRNPQSFQALHELLEQQAYRLAFWRVAADEINYRRFFDINELAGIRMENPDVFAQVHRLVGRLISEGKLNGLRLDHIDGLFDPGGYLAQLRGFVAERSRALYIVAEKILARHERLRTDWPIAGTTGYEFINLVNGVFVDPDGKQALDRTYRRFLDRSADFDEILYASKLLVVDTMLASELNRLASALDALSERHWSTRDYTEERLRAALREVVACFPVYRTYVTASGVSAEDRRDIDWAIRQARRSFVGPDPEILDFVRAALTTDLAGWNPAFERDEVLRFAMRFQQYTGPVMAKALEDTTFYRYNRLLSLNEVGGDPRQFGVTVSAFHHLMQERAKSWPHAMSPLATHDTKRGADVRARLNLLSELAPEWNQRVRRWASLNRFTRGKVAGAAAPSPNDEYAIYQALLGAWPAEISGRSAPDAAAIEPFRRRVQDTVLKSIREAKRRTSWSNPNEAYEGACLRFIERVLEVDRPNPFLDDFLAFQGRIAQLGMLNSLSQAVLALTAPGVPDIYQGGGSWDLNMVDPDNRRPIDFALRRRMLDEILQAEGDRRERIREWLAAWPDGRIKLAVVSALLRCRRTSSGLFARGSYEPLGIQWPHAHHFVGFARRDSGQTCIVIAARLFARLLGEHASYRGAVWGDAQLELPDAPQRVTNVLTGETMQCGASLRLSELLADLPAAVLFAQS